MTLAITIIVASVLFIIIGAGCAFSAIRNRNLMDMGIPKRFFVGWVFNLLGGLGFVVGVVLLAFALYEMYS